MNGQSICERSADLILILTRRAGTDQRGTNINFTNENPGFEEKIDGISRSFIKVKVSLHLKNESA